MLHAGRQFQRSQFANQARDASTYGCLRADRRGDSGRALWICNEMSKLLSIIVRIVLLVKWAI